MKKNVSVAGEIVSKHLLSALKKEKDFAPARKEYAGVSYSLRKCWQWRHTGGHRWEREKVATGGMILEAEVYRDAPVHTTWKRTYRIKLENIIRIATMLPVAITRINNEAQAEIARNKVIVQLHDFCDTINKTPAFIRYIDKMEPETGTSCYADMTIDDVLRWFPVITRWKLRYGKKTKKGGK